jgi:predicted nucleic acid-binding protein
VKLREDLDPGEAACLALATEEGCLVACDEKGFFRTLGRKLLGEGRILNTPGLFVLGIQHGYWSVADADRAKDVLAENRYRMKIRTFRDLL